MTTEARDVLAAFEALDAIERQQVAVEILRRSTAVADLSDEAFRELATEVFQGYDTEESTDRAS